MKVIGFRKSSFKGDDGSQVSGVNLYLTEKCEKGEGQSCERVYITDQRLTACGYVPKLGDEVALEYNRWGKCSGVRLIKTNLNSCCERRDDVHRQSCPQQVGVKAPTRALDTITNSGKCLLYVDFHLPRSQHSRVRKRHL